MPSLKERLGMTMKLLERLVISDVPAYFAAGALSPETVRFTPAQDCSFDFNLSDFPDYAKVGFQEACSALYQVYAELFKTELKAESIAEIKSQAVRLKGRGYKNWLEILEEFRPIYEKYSQTEEEKLENKSFWFRMWDKVKALGQQLKRFALLAVVLLALAYTVFAIRNYMQPTVQKDVYPAIGDLQLHTTSAEPAEESQGGGK